MNGSRVGADELSVGCVVVAVWSHKYPLELFRDPLGDSGSSTIACDADVPNRSNTLPLLFSDRFVSPDVFAVASSYSIVKVGAAVVADFDSIASGRAFSTGSRQALADACTSAASLSSL